MKEVIIRKLTSRKLWAAIAGFVSMLMVYRGATPASAESVASLILAGASIVGYILGEGLADAAGAGISGKEEDEEEA